MIDPRTMVQSESEGTTKFECQLCVAPFVVSSFVRTRQNQTWSIHAALLGVRTPTGVERIIKQGKLFLQCLSPEPLAARTRCVASASVD